jgi:FkbH-like protein
MDSGASFNKAEEGRPEVKHSPAMDLRGREAREEIDRLIASGEWTKASLGLSTLWRADPSSATAGFLLARYEGLRSHLALLPYRVAILRSFTVEPVVPLLRAAGYVAGLDLDVRIGGFNMYPQEIFDSSSSVYVDHPDAVILAVGTREVASDLWHDYVELTDAEREAVVDRLGRDYRDWVSTFRRYSPAHLILHTLEAPIFPAHGILDSQAARGQAEVIAAVNAQLRALAREYSGVFALDYDALVARYGRRSWTDQRKWLAMRLPVAAGHLQHMADEWLRFLQPLSGRVAKGLVVDLDNTLWGGVIGEDGMAGIRLGAEYPGAEHQQLQRVLRDLRQRGIVLAIASKNNPEDAVEVFEQHPGMLLRLKDFAAVRINWSDKAQQLREIAAELNIGLDTLAFLDDNPVERDHVRSQLPDVHVLDVRADATEFARVVQENPLFQRLRISAEDLQRGEYYRAQQERAELERSANSPEDFYRSLQQEVVITRASPVTVPRVAQLTQKTNQFNLTTRRYTEQQVADLAGRPDWSVWVIRVRDRYGDNGLVGVGILHHIGDICEIDTFLLSCRVIGRAVETAFLARLLRECREREARALQGWFLPTKKNALAADVYPSHGFEVADRDGLGTLWRFDAHAGNITVPEWIRQADVAPEVGVTGEAEEAASDV